MFGELICSFCIKYLSIGPIKVYPNGKVKCGRCSEENDGGTESKLYEMLAKELTFPCVNQLDGCQNLLAFSETEEHEKTCFGTTCVCPICHNFKGLALSLIGHFKLSHSCMLLDNSNKIFIFLNNDNKEGLYFYINTVEKILMFICVRYDSVASMLFIKVSPFIKNNDNEMVTYNFELWTTDNEIKYKSIRKSMVVCLEDESNIPHKSDNYPNAITIVKFNINKTRQIHFKKCLSSPPELPKPIVIEKLVEGEKVKDILNYLNYKKDSSALTYSFYNIKQLTEMFSPYFYACNSSWRLCLRKDTTNIDGKIYLGIFLYKSDEDNKCSWRVNATFEVLSYKASNNIQMSFTNRYGKRSGESLSWGFSDIAMWSKLLNPQFEFIRRNENHITISLDLSIEMLKHKANCKCYGCRI